jgi:hypothetical protein
MALVSVNCIYRVFIKGAIAFINKGSLFIRGLSKAAEARVVDNIKGVNKHNLR